MPITIDASERPIIWVRFVGVASEEEFDVYLTELDRHVLQGEGVTVAILDATRSGETPPRQREKQAEWIKRSAPRLRTQSAGTAFIITSRLVRGFLTAILWMAPLQTPHVVVETEAEARQWAVERLKQRGVVIGR